MGCVLSDLPPHAVPGDCALHNSSSRAAASSVPFALAERARCSFGCATQVRGRAAKRSNLSLAFAVATRAFETCQDMLGIKRKKKDS
jgi:hypothetical protein